MLIKDTQDWVARARALAPMVEDALTKDHNDPAAARNPLSIAGAAITTVVAGLFLFVFFLDVFGIHTNPYIGLVFFLHGARLPREQDRVTMHI